MQRILDLLTELTGLAINGFVFWDVFQSIIVPHHRPQSGRISPLLISKLLWPACRGFVKTQWAKGQWHDSLTLFAPAAMMSLLVFWLTLMTFGFSLILWGERTSTIPQINNFGMALYFAATSILTIGYGDVTPGSPVAKFAVICAAVCGITLLAIMVAFIFAIQSHFHVREVTSEIISSRHEHSSNGAAFYRNLKSEGIAGSSLELCERWVTEIFQSHSAYPLLLYFRSRSSRASWLVQFGVLLDAVSIALALKHPTHRILLNSIYENGSLAMQKFARYLRLKMPKTSLSQETFVPLFISLEAKNPQEAAHTFVKLRESYYPSLHCLSEFFLVVLPHLNVGDNLEFSPSEPEFNSLPDKPALELNLIGKN